VENSVARKALVEISEVEIKDYASVKVVQCPEVGSLDIQAKAMEVHHFCVRHGQVQIHASFIPHPIELNGGEAIFLVFPKSDWQIKIVFQSGTEFYTLQMEASRLHTMINPQFNHQSLETASKMNMRDLMKLIPVNPSLLTCFDQLLHHKLQPPFQAIFEQAKFLEIFSLLMETAFGQRMDACPVMMSPAIESKIHRVRLHIIDNIDQIPDPDHLAMIYELPRNTLREGYRYMYGKTIHQYHADHKLESAMQMLESGELLVKEIAFKIGYQNPSHFISAFKKKYGYTPKQYLRQAQV